MIASDEIVEVTKTVPTKTVPTKTGPTKTVPTKVLQLQILLITITLLITVGICCYLIKYSSKQKHLL